MTNRIIHICRKPYRCCWTCNYHAPICRHGKGSQS